MYRRANLRRFSIADDERLVAAVREFPAIYNHEKCANGRNQPSLRDNWQKVAEAAGKDEDTCKKRWRDIRDHFFKVKRKQQKSGNCFTKWPLYDSLYFLNNAKRKYRYASPRDQDGEFSDAEEINKHEGAMKLEVDYTRPDSALPLPSQMEYVTVTPTESQDFLDDTQDPVNELKSVSLLEALAEKNDKDDIDMFMSSMTYTIKKFPPEKRAEAKMKILAVVTQLEFPDLMSSSSVTSV